MGAPLAPCKYNTVGPLPPRRMRVRQPSTVIKDSSNAILLTPVLINGRLDAGGKARAAGKLNNLAGHDIQLGGHVGILNTAIGFERLQAGINNGSIRRGPATKRMHN